MKVKSEQVKSRRSHIFPHEPNAHYVEPSWVARRLFDVEKFHRNIVDPCAGWGRCVRAARRAGYNALGHDLVARVSEEPWWRGARDFLTAPFPYTADVVTNPPFHLLEQVIARALAVTHGKVALLVPWRRLPAADWFVATPPASVWVLRPRPSMPPGSYIRNGGFVGGGTADYCWVIWEKDHRGPTVLKQLHRDGSSGVLKRVTVNHGEGPVTAPRVSRVDFTGVRFDLVDRTQRAARRWGGPIRFGVRAIAAGTGLNRMRVMGNIRRTDGASGSYFAGRPIEESARAPGLASRNVKTPGPPPQFDVKRSDSGLSLRRI